MTGDDARTARPRRTPSGSTGCSASLEMDRIPNHDFVATDRGTGVAMEPPTTAASGRWTSSTTAARRRARTTSPAAPTTPPRPLPAAPGKTTFWYDFPDSPGTVGRTPVERPRRTSLTTRTTTFEISLDSEFLVDPQRVYSGAYVRYDGGEVYLEDTDISNEFTRRDAVVPAENVKTSAKATLRARTLPRGDGHRGGAHRLTSVQVPAAKVNWAARACASCSGRPTSQRNTARSAGCGSCAGR